MATYFMFGKYSGDSVKEIARERTRDVVGIVEQANGQIMAMYGLLGAYDLVFIVNLPGNNEAMRASIELTKRTGVTFTTAPAVAMDRFDALLSDAGPDDEDEPFEHRSPEDA